MTNSSLTIVAATAAVGSAAAGGTMFAFSTFVMRGLDRTGAVDAITAMRGINAEAKSNAVFLLAYLGAALLALAVGVLCATHWSQPGTGWLLAGAFLGVLGAVVTIAFNVPLNDQLDAARVSASSASAVWQSYLSSWIAWNHVRTATSLVAAALMMIGLAQR